MSEQAENRLDSLLYAVWYLTIGFLFGYLFCLLACLAPLTLG